jgi:hypothetical protein
MSSLEHPIPTRPTSPHRERARGASAALVAAAALGACAATEPAPVVQLPVTTSSAPLASATTDLGYLVEPTALRIAVSGVQFTIEGEAHSAVAPPGTALHPGHAAGGEVTGELPGFHVLSWTGQTAPVLGLGTLVVGDYRGANFTFRPTDARDALAAADPLRDHTFHVTASVTRGGVTRALDAVLDVEPGAQVIGAVFEHRVTEASTEAIALAFRLQDPAEGDTAFDGVDFFSLPVTTAGRIEIRPGSAAHNVMRRALQTHDHYSVVAQ